MSDYAPVLLCFFVQIPGCTVFALCAILKKELECDHEIIGKDEDHL